MKSIVAFMPIAKTEQYQAQDSKGLSHELYD
jgi:hypothetical protein